MVVERVVAAGREGLAGCDCATRASGPCRATFPTPPAFAIPRPALRTRRLLPIFAHQTLCRAVSSSRRRHDAVDIPRPRRPSASCTLIAKSPLVKPPGCVDNATTASITAAIRALARLMPATRAAPTADGSGNDSQVPSSSVAESAHCTTSRKRFSTSFRCVTTGDPAHQAVALLSASARYARSPRSGEHVRLSCTS